MLSSLARYLEPLPEEEGDPFLTQIQALFQSDFISKQQEEGDSANTSLRPEDSDDFASDQLIVQEQGGGDYDQDSCSSAQHNTDTTSETASSTVLHLGSVLSPEHDYLLWRTKHL